MKKFFPVSLGIILVFAVLFIIVNDVAACKSQPEDKVFRLHFKEKLAKLPCVERQNLLQVI